jgi:hypothetical protein
MFFVWYDDNPKKAVKDKIDEAVLRYKQKYGKMPNLCMLSEKIQSSDYSPAVSGLNLQIRTAKNVPQNYFWIGNEA